jgi:hypothetical protein
VRCRWCRESAVRPAEKRVYCVWFLARGIQRGDAFRFAASGRRLADGLAVSKDDGPFAVPRTADDEGGSAYRLSRSSRWLDLHQPAILKKGDEAAVRGPEEIGIGLANGWAVRESSLRTQSCPPGVPMPMKASQRPSGDTFPPA